MPGKASKLTLAAETNPYARLFLHNLGQEIIRHPARREIVSRIVSDMTGELPKKVDVC